jgi:Zn-dependent oligopeptidase
MGLQFLQDNTNQNQDRLDEQRFSEYFPLDQTVTGIMDIYSSLFGLRFVEIPTETSFISGNDNVMIWHDDVLVYNVWNDENLGGDSLGYLYLHSFPRENTYNHAGHYGLVPVSSFHSSNASSIIKTEKFLYVGIRRRGWRKDISIFYLGYESCKTNGRSTKPFKAR